MTPIEFPEQTVVWAKNQPEYRPLPAHIDHRSVDRRTTFCWRLDWRERFALLFRGLLWHEVLTFGQPLQPQLLSVDKPQFPNDYENKANDEAHPRHGQDEKSEAAKASAHPIGDAIADTFA